VAESVIEGIRAERFLILPHPEVEGQTAAKTTDRDSWLRGMRRLRVRHEQELEREDRVSHSVPHT
jgi:hypothetical protein